MRGDDSQQRGFDYVSADVAVDIPFAPLTDADHGGFGMRYRAAEAIGTMKDNHQTLLQKIGLGDRVKDSVICCWVSFAAIIVILDILDVAPIFESESQGAGGIILLVLTIFFALVTVCFFILRFHDPNDGTEENQFGLSDADSQDTD